MIKRSPPTGQRSGRLDTLVNESITVDSVLLIDSEGNNLGKLSRDDALEHAEKAGLDLVIISPHADPPVARIMDYGKHKYEIQKKQHQARKNQKTIDVKEIKIRPGIEQHDYEVKMRAIDKFINDGSKVKVTLRFRGREMAHKELGYGLLQRMIEEVDEKTKVENIPKLEGRQITMVLGPR